MKYFVAIVALAALGYGGWWFANEQGWVDRGSALTETLEDKKEQDFNKP